MLGQSHQQRLSCVAAIVKLDEARCFFWGAVMEFAPKNLLEHTCVHIFMFTDISM